MPERKRCVDCEREGIETYRKIKPKSGGRCVTHARARRKQTSEKAAETRWMNVYGITAEEYWAIYEYQGGVCYICERANGKRKRLSVDHDHKTGFVRGLCCSKCNRDILGHARDDIGFFNRAIDYLNNPPAFAVIGQRPVPGHKEEK